MKVLFFVGSGRSTSIPIELAAKVNNNHTADVSCALYYDSSPQDLDSDVREFDLDYYFLDAKRRVDRRGLNRLLNLLSDFDILHTHTNFIGSIARLLAARSDVKVIDTEHNDHRHIPSIKNAVNFPTYPFADRIVCNSQSTLNSFSKVERLFCSEGKCTVIYNGVDLERIENGRDHVRPPKLPAAPRIVTAASLTKQKNIPVILDAMKILKANFVDGNLVIVGDGPARQKLELYTERLGIGDYVTFLGYLPTREEVYATMGKCDVFVASSKYEGFCNAAVEAMACGVPVVASDIAVLKEVIGRGGVYAKTRDPTQFADKISHLLQDEGARAELRQRAEKRAKTKFSLDRSARQYYMTYKTVLLEETTEGIQDQLTGHQQ